jgi:acyl carrier protein
VENKLVEIWSGTLDLDKDVISIDSNFFELGGHSLKATVLLSKIHKELKSEIFLKEFFRSPTVMEISELIGVIDSPNGAVNKKTKTKKVVL